MTATNHTEHYELSQYTEDDRPTYTGDYNSDMAKIDAAIYEAAQTGGGGTGGIGTVTHTDDLTGDGTADSPLGVAGTVARTAALSAYATTESVSQTVNTAVADRPTTSQVAQSIADAIADRLTALNIKAGNAISVSVSGNDVTISYTGGGSSGGLAAVAHDSTLLGDGTTSSPLKMAKGTILTLNAIDVNSQSSHARDMNNLSEGFTRVSGLKEKLLNAPDMSYVGGNYVSALVMSVTVGSGVKVQTWITAKTSDMKIHMRGYNQPSWTNWITIAPLSQSAPSATGLTAEQLDSQYSDGYNIVRVGTPTQLNESEVNPNE